MKTPSSAPTATFGLEPAGYRALLDCFAQAESILVYSGAGMSADSGLPTYRGEGEHLWTDDVLERVATATGFARDPGYAVEWYIAQSSRLRAARPHAGHLALLDMERHWKVTHVTQNVDVLLEDTGCADVVHLHGRYDELKCMRCSWEGRVTEPDVLRRPCPVCSGQLRPAIVWMGEMPDPDVILQAEVAAASADLVLVIGTPAEMYPGAAVVEAAHQGGAAICVINPHWCENLHYAHWQLFAGARDALPSLARDAIARRQIEGKPLPWFLRWLPAWAR